MWMEFTSFGTQTEVEGAFPAHGRNKLSLCACGITGAAGDEKGVNFLAQSLGFFFPPVDVSAGLPHPNDVVFVS